MIPVLPYDATAAINSTNLLDVYNNITSSSTHRKVAPGMMDSFLSIALGLLLSAIVALISYDRLFKKKEQV